MNERNRDNDEPRLSHVDEAGPGGFAWSTWETSR